MVAEVEAKRWVSLRGDRSHPANGGSLCIKGSHARDVVYSSDRLTHPLKKTKGGFKQISWDEALTEIAERMEEIKEKSFIRVTPPLKFGMSRQKGFKTPTGKVEFYSEKLRESHYDPLPSFNESLLKRDERYPLLGTTRRPGVYVHTKFRNISSLRKLHPDPMLEIHPEEAQKREIGEGSRVQVESPTGKVSLRIHVNEEMMTDLALADFGWGNPEDGGPNVNIITDDTNRDPVTGTTGNREFRCRIYLEQKED